jgi:HAD superfamily hydrolase (TIGR01509 family)
MNLKCIIFDLDGTLVDSESLSNKVLLDLLPAIDESVEKLTNRYHGKRLAEIFIDIERRFKFPIPEGFEPIYRAHVAQLFEKELKPIPGVAEMLEQINHPRCIASSGPLAKMKHSLKITGLGEFFGSNLFSAYEIGTWKPDPGLFIHAAREMGFKPEECVVVEDSLTGVKAAKSADMVVLHFSSKPFEEKGKTYCAFNNMVELPVLLQEYGSAA